LLLADHQNDVAVGLIQQLSKRPFPAGPAWVQFDLALAYLLAGSYEKAIKQAHAYAESLPQGASESKESAQAWSLIGIAYAHLGQGERSVNALRQAATLAPGEEEQWLNLTRELMELNRYSEAISAVQNGLAANPESYALHLRLGAADLSLDVTRGGDCFSESRAGRRSAADELHWVGSSAAAHGSGERGCL